MEKNIYDVDYFIKKFEAIPEDKWCVGDVDDGHGRHCAQGYCGLKHNEATRVVNDDSLLPELGAFGKLFHATNRRQGIGTISEINNGADKRYQQPTPKARILAALMDIKAQQQPEVKERIVYVVVDAKVRELQKLESPN